MIHDAALHSFHRIAAAIEVGNPSLVMLPASRKEAKRLASTHYFSGKPCRHGHVAPRFSSDVNCTVCHRIRERRRRRTDAHRSWERGYIKKPAVRAYCRAFNVMRDARKKMSVPPWLTPAQFREIEAHYQEAARLTVKTGVPHQVDHIIPVIHDDVCGWHVPWNFQVLSASENRRKSNSFDGTLDNEGWRT